jgi:hypothetical protein
MPSELSIAPTVAETTTTLQNAAAAPANGTTLVLTSADDLATITMVNSAGTATVVIEESIDAGVSWLGSFPAELVAGALTLVSSIALAANTRRFLYTRPPGVNALRCRVSVIAGGTVTVTATVRRRI